MGKYLTLLGLLYPFREIIPPYKSMLKIYLFCFGALWKLIPKKRQIPHKTAKNLSQVYHFGTVIYLNC